MQSVQAQKIRKRNLARYDNGGEFDFNFGIGEKEKAAMNSRLREFLWTHWSQKKLGRVEKTIYYTLEGDPAVTIFYVEPDKNGHWIIREETTTFCCFLYFTEKRKRKPLITTSRTVYKIIERVEIVGKANLNNNTLTAIPKVEVRKPYIYLLRLSRDEDDNSEGLIL